MSTLLTILSFLRPSNNPLLKEELSQFPEIREFVFRPYVNRYWKVRDRLQAIQNHYLLVNECLPFLNLANKKSVEIAQYDFGQDKLRIVMDRPAWMRREGELGISFFYGIDRIYTATFLVAGTRDKLQLMVGNLQGDGRDRQALYKEFTKAMHGMRPRDFLIHVLKILGQELGCTEILGISDDAHRSSHWLTRAKKVSTYDQIWLEHDGVKDEATGFFIIPSRISKRTVEEIPSNKRGLYRRRYQLIDELQLTIGALVKNAGSNRSAITRN